MDNERSQRVFKVHAKKVLTNPDAHPLKVARVKLGIRQEDLANMAHICRSTLVSAERGGNIEDTTRAALAEIVGEW